MSKFLSVDCPMCKKNFNYYSSESRPFCSERCQQVDLGHWVCGNYSVEGKPASPEDLTEALMSQNSENQKVWDETH